MSKNRKPEICEQKPVKRLWQTELEILYFARKLYQKAIHDYSFGEFTSALSVVMQLEKKLKAVERLIGICKAKKPATYDSICYRLCSLKCKGNQAKPICGETLNDLIDKGGPFLVPEEMLLPVVWCTEDQTPSSPEKPEKAFIANV